MDLGTTFSKIAHYDVNTRRVEVIPDMMGQRLVPSTVYYPETDDPIVGWEALDIAASDPDRLVRWIKMSMGTDFKKKIGDKEYTPEEVSAEILKKLRRNAEAYLGEPVNLSLKYNDSGIILGRGGVTSEGGKVEIPIEIHPYTK